MYCAAFYASLLAGSGNNAISFPECSFPSTSDRKTRDPGSNHFEITKEKIDSTHPVHCAVCIYCARLEWLPLESLVFRSLVKGNEDSVNDIGNDAICNDEKNGGLY